MEDEKVINSPAAKVPRNRKKSEGEKRNSPCTPYREKGKVKEQYRVSYETRSSKTAQARTRVRARHLPCTCTYQEAGEAAAEIISRCFGNWFNDHGNWAFYCRHFNRAIILEKAYTYASRHRQGEVRDPVTAFQSWLKSEYGPKKGGAR